MSNKARVLALSLAVACIFWTGQSLAGDCETPLPDDAAVKDPGPDVPEEFKRFSGMWQGSWRDVLCHTLVVESVASDGSVRAIYSWGTYIKWDVHEGFRLETGKIEDGELKLRRFGNGAEVTYWFSGDDLEATYVRRGRTTPGTFSRVSE